MLPKDSNTHALLKTGGISEKQNTACAQKALKKADFTMYSAISEYSDKIRSSSNLLQILTVDKKMTDLVFNTIRHFHGVFHIGVYMDKNKKIRDYRKKL